MKFERLFVMQKYAKLQVLSSFSAHPTKKDNELVSETHIFLAVLKKIFTNPLIYYLNLSFCIKHYLRK